MRRVTSVASSGLRLACLIALASSIALAPAALAQHGSGGHGGGFGGGHSGGFGGGFSSGHSFGGFSGHSFGGSSGSFGRSSSFGSFGFRGNFGSYGTRGYSYAPRMTWPAPARGTTPGLRSNYAYGSGTPWRGSGRYDRDRYRSAYRGYGYGYGYPANSWYVLPWELGYPDFYGYDNGSWVGQSDQAAPQQDQSYQDQGNDLGPEGDYRPAYGDAPQENWAGRASVAQPQVADEPALTLVFNDGHQQSIRNYALTSNDLLVLDDTGSGRAQRIPLSDVNVPATQRAAQSAGLDFTPPPSGAPASF